MVYPDDAELELRPTPDPELWVGRSLYSRSGAILITYGESFVIWKGKLHLSPGKWPNDQVHGGHDGSITFSICSWLSVDGSQYESAVFNQGKWSSAHQVIPFRGADGKSYRLNYIIPPYDPERPQDSVPFWTPEILVNGVWKAIVARGEIFDVSPEGHILTGNSDASISRVTVVTNGHLHRLNESQVRWIGPGNRYVSVGWYGPPEEPVFRFDEGMGKMKPLESSPGWPKGAHVQECYGWSRGGWLLKFEKAGKSAFATFRPK